MDPALIHDLYQELAERLEAAGLITEHATSDHERTLINTWQLPMYNMNFAKISVPLERLREQREANIPYEV